MPNCSPYFCRQREIIKRCFPPLKPALFRIGMGRPAQRWTRSTVTREAGQRHRQESRGLNIGQTMKKSREAQAPSRLLVPSVPIVHLVFWVCYSPLCPMTDWKFCPPTGGMVVGHGVVAKKGGGVVRQGVQKKKSEVSREAPAIQNFL